MKEKLEELRKDIFLELSSWGGLGPMPGTGGLIITKDKKIYYYHSYFRISSQFIDKVDKEGITDGEIIDDNIYKELEEYINNKIRGKEFNPQKIFDAGYTVSGNDFKIVNHYEIYDEIRKIIKGGK
jgi:hypothetical protein